MKILASLCLLWLPIVPAWCADPLPLESDARGEVVILLTKERIAGGMDLRTPIPSVVSLRFAASSESTVPYLVFNPDATQARIEFAPSPKKNTPDVLTLDVAERSGQLADGRIVFSAIDARIVGSTAKLESHPGNHRIGFWTQLDDRVEWDYTPTRPGAYDLELTYSLAGDATSDIRISLGENSLSAVIEGTGSWYRYRTVPLGRMQLATGETRVSVSATAKTGAAAMNLKAIVLRPAPEGKPIVQADNGEVLCHARDVTIHGVKVQYEPRPEKNTVGFWVNPDDWVSWDFEVCRPGRFAVEVLQGCGKDHGGSRVSVFVNEQKLEFTVEDTGHFQNFKPRVIGEVAIEQPGRATLRIVPIDKKSVAVMDVRQVRLIPVK